VVAARRNSPLVIGLGEGENFLGSDVAAFIDYTRTAVEIGQDEVVTITPDEVTITDIEGTLVEGEQFEVDWDTAAAEKGGFASFIDKEIHDQPQDVADTLLGPLDSDARLTLDEFTITDNYGTRVEGEQFKDDRDTAAAEKGRFASFMDKEIHDQPQAVADTLLGRLDTEGRLTLDEMRIDESVLNSIDKIVVIACGTAAYAGQVAKYAIEHWCRIPTEVELAHEFRYRDP